ncbi:SlyX family protein [Galenea microaerophila]
MTKSIETIEDRVMELEMTVAYQQETLEALQTNLAKQFQENQQLHYKLQLLSDYLKSLNLEALKKPSEEVPPPHY